MPLTVLLLALAAPASAATMRPGTACPARRGDLPLRGGLVLDDPPEDKAILKPEDGDGGDEDSATWPGLDHVYRAGRKVWLGCSYVDDAPVYMAVDRPVSVCRYRERRGLVRLSCH